MTNPSTGFYRAICAGVLECAGKWGEVWVASYCEKLQILTPHLLLLTSGQGSKSKPVLGWRRRQWINVLAFGTHMEWCDRRPPRPPTSHGRGGKAITGNIVANPNRDSWKGEQRTPHWKWELWGLREVREEELCVYCWVIWRYRMDMQIHVERAHTRLTA